MLLIEYQYFPPINVIKTSIEETHIIIPLYEEYRKMSFRNRCMIPTSNGVCSLTVPLSGGRNNRLILKDVRIDQRTAWQQQHWRTIYSAYGKSPWFEFYRDGLEPFFNRDYTFLADWNMELLHWVFSVIGAKMKIEARVAEDIFGPENRIFDLRNKILPKNFQENKWAENGPFYPQVFQEKIGFQSNMSIIDLIFCEGKNTLYSLRKATS